jgi:hypothetical protein
MSYLALRVTALEEQLEAHPVISGYQRAALIVRAANESGLMADSDRIAAETKAMVEADMIAATERL